MQQKRIILCGLGAAEADAAQLELGAAQVRAQLIKKFKISFSVIV
jgi:hypothetical protein